MVELPLLDSLPTLQLPLVGDSTHDLGYHFGLAPKDSASEATDRGAYRTAGQPHQGVGLEGVGGDKWV